MNKQDAQQWIDAYADVRADGYIMLASLLQQPPTKKHLDILQNIQWEETIPEKLNQALETLRQASRDHYFQVIHDEYNRLFVGLGSGEIVPYASWYKEKRIQSLSLAILRSDLMKIGIMRQAGCHESEDHAGALCEIMAIISQTQNGIASMTQANFFHRHIAPWMIRFFKDVQSAKSADFYRVVGLFGQCFLEIEREFLPRDVKDQDPVINGERLQSPG